MSVISKSALADYVGKKRSEVSRALSKHLIVATADGLIDTENPVNAQWIAEKKTGTRRASAAHKPASPAPEPPPSAVFDLGDEPDDELDAIASHEEEKRKLTVARRLHYEKETVIKELRIARDKGLLIPRDLERRKWAAFDAGLKTNLRDLPRRASARLHAIAVAEGPRALESALESEISEALARTVETAKGAGLEA